MPRLDNIHTPVLVIPFSRNSNRLTPAREQRLQNLQNDVVNIRRQIDINNQLITLHESNVVILESQKEDIKKEIEITDKLIENNEQQIKLMEGIIAATERIIEIKQGQAKKDVTLSTPQQTASSTYQRTSNLNNETPEQECSRYIEQAMQKLRVNKKQKVDISIAQAKQTKSTTKPTEVKNEPKESSLRRFLMFENFKMELKSIDRMFSFLRKN